MFDMADRRLMCNIAIYEYFVRYVLGNKIKCKPTWTMSIGHRYYFDNFTQSRIYTSGHCFHPNIPISGETLWSDLHPF